MSQNVVSPIASQILTFTIVHPTAPVVFEPQNTTVTVTTTCPPSTIESPSIEESSTISASTTNPPQTTTYSVDGKPCIDYFTSTIGNTVHSYCCTATNRDCPDIAWTTITVATTVVAPRIELYTTNAAITLPTPSPLSFTPVLPTTSTHQRLTTLTPSLAATITPLLLHLPSFPNSATNSINNSTLLLLSRQKQLPKWAAAPSIRDTQPQPQPHLMTTTINPSGLSLITTTPGTVVFFLYIIIPSLVVAVLMQSLRRQLRNTNQRMIMKPIAEEESTWWKLDLIER
ncbi:hypothetical protein H2198_005212 [Neophaeococcomyces mojaviensis]|uniref:Uncharacterized protein n=1 Tax=Neophaeococcomyces mojaviensis TaxID=3383035 RepID=A0ACC3A6L3_9EURO|nr:hypothetical protein H2198_005212 [Knufia sp. JES_112]